MPCITLHEFASTDRLDTQNRLNQSALLRAALILLAHNAGQAKILSNAATLAIANMQLHALYVCIANSLTDVGQGVQLMSLGILGPWDA